MALIGAIGTHKGYRVLLDCARDARARRLPIEFVVIGYTEKDAPLLATGKVFITGRYGEVEAPALLRREQPDIAWLPSVWPETWCYTLDYALGARVPVVAFDLGAIAERLRAAGGGILLPLDLSPRHINDKLLDLAATTRRDSAEVLRSVQTQPSNPHLEATMQATQNGEMSMKKGLEAKPAESAPPQDVKDEGLSASVQVLPLPGGLYLFSVKAATPAVAGTAGKLSLPAIHVGLGPGVRTDQVEFIAGPSTHGAWLFAPGDLLVTKINGTGATLILTSIRAPGGEVLSIKVERLDARADAVAAAPASVVPLQTPNAPSPPAVPGSDVDAGLPVFIAAHIRTRGDMGFANAPWAGRVAPGLWIESFSVRPLEKFSAQDVEYKALTGSGFETPWLSDDKMCGTKGMSVPLVGFAVRFKPSAAAATYDCEYSGYFKSGLTIGPLRNGAPCRSTVANDPLEGIQVRLVKRSGATLPVAKSGGRIAKRAPQAAPAAAKPKSLALAAVKRRNGGTPAARTSSPSARSTRRPATRRP